MRLSMLAVRRVGPVALLSSLTLFATGAAAQTPARAPAEQPAKQGLPPAAAAERGLNPNVWFNNVEPIAAEKIGRETVTYVSNISKYCLAYQVLEEERREREKAKEAARSGTGR